MTKSFFFIDAIASCRSVDADSWFIWALTRLNAVPAFRGDVVGEVSPGGVVSTVVYHHDGATSHRRYVPDV